MSLVKACTKAVRLRENSRLAWSGIDGREVERRQDRDAAPATVSPGRDSSQLPPPSAARSTMTAPGFIDRTISAVMSLGANTPPISAVVITTSDCAHCAARSSRWRAWSSSDSSLA